MSASPASVAERLRAFFGSRIWGVRLADLPPHRAAAYRVSRILYSTVRGYLDNHLTTRAAALTYFGVLSIVPALAFAFALLKGFGVYQSFIEGTVRPYLRDNFAANPALYEAIGRVLQFVDRTDVSRLGTLGVLFLLYTSVTLLSGVEQTLNRIFGAKGRRPFVRQLTDYTTLLVTAPILLAVATTISAAAQSSRFVLLLRNTVAIGAVIDFLVGVTPVLAVGLALFAIYAILPNVRIRAVSALLGAAVAAVLWQGALILHVQFQVGVARYNALYSFLGALPIFLVWTYVSWLVVLVGAQLAASHQNEQVVRQRFHARRADPALRETLAVAISVEIARDFLAGGARRSAAALAEFLEVSPPLVEEVLEALARSGLVARVVAGREIAWAPGRDLDAVRARDLRDALRRDPSADEARAAVGRQLGPGLQRVLRALDEGNREVGELTLRELAALVPDGRTAGAPPREPGNGGGGEESDVVDAKQPDVPA